MNKYQPSPSPFAGQDSSGASEDPSQRSRRPRAPQFGSDRRGPRDAEASRNRTGRARAEVDGNRDRRSGLPDRRQSTAYLHKEALR
jgi:hypothetical protein